MLLKRGQIWHCKFMFSGVMHRRSLHTRKRDTAVKLESAFRASLVNGEFGIHDTHGTPTLEAFEAKLLPHLKANTAPRTYAFYLQNLKVLKAFAPMREARLHKIDASLIERFIQSRLRQKGKPLAPVTINHSLRTLRRVLHVAEEWALIRKAPKIRLLPGENEREYVISDADAIRFTDGFATLYPDTVMQFLFQFLIDTGLRISEACALKKRTLDRGVYPRSQRQDQKCQARDTTNTACTARSGECRHAFSMRLHLHWQRWTQAFNAPLSQRAVPHS